MRTVATAAFVAAIVPALLACCCVPAPNQGRTRQQIMADAKAEREAARQAKDPVREHAQKEAIEAGQVPAPEPEPADPRPKLERGKRLGPDDHSHYFALCGPADKAGVDGLEDRYPGSRWLRYDAAQVQVYFRKDAKLVNGAPAWSMHAALDTEDNEKLELTEAVERLEHIAKYHVIDPAPKEAPRLASVDDKPVAKPAGGGSFVRPTPSMPSPSMSSGRTVQVKGHYRKDGTYVRPHVRRR